MFTSEKEIDELIALIRSRSIPAFILLQDMLQQKPREINGDLRDS